MIAGDRAVVFAAARLEDELAAHLLAWDRAADLAARAEVRVAAGACVDRLRVLAAGLADAAGITHNLDALAQALARDDLAASRAALRVLTSPGPGTFGTWAI